MTAPPRQIPMPPETRKEFPPELGTIMIWKVLTNHEHKENKKTKKEESTPTPPKPKLKDPRSYSCSFSIFQYSKNLNLIELKPTLKTKITARLKTFNSCYCLFNLGTVMYEICETCLNHQQATGFKIFTSVKIIDTGDIELPSIHYKREKKQEKKIDYSGFT